ncbi:uncharacterized protein CIMG_13177 [Coccidioides immitis RS]|uniref:Uncharacterized protein n=1 Tax=Coccidioides immitis (strain RS) TaxID=246410 RepID=A0A0D8JUD8_COCIM|nr:uncharacterized protein CIMG_13177 [Coccidioides immitis RS]KJF60729.1 hypothetical protein CIMG_13177 [Coccidioides immitis RS]
MTLDFGANAISFVIGDEVGCKGEYPGKEQSTPTRILHSIRAAEPGCWEGIPGIEGGTMAEELYVTFEFKLLLLGLPCIVSRKRVRAVHRAVWNGGFARIGNRRLQATQGYRDSSTVLPLKRLAPAAKPRDLSFGPWKDACTSIPEILVCRHIRPPTKAWTASGFPGKMGPSFLPVNLSAGDNAQWAPSLHVLRTYGVPILLFRDERGLGRSSETEGTKRNAGTRRSRTS